MTALSQVKAELKQSSPSNHETDVVSDEDTENKISNADAVDISDSEVNSEDEAALVDSQTFGATAEQPA